jgi:hypothetical protein
VDKFEFIFLKPNLMELPRGPFISPASMSAHRSADPTARLAAGRTVMNWHKCATLISGTILVLSAVPANAASCTSEIAQFEDIVRHSENSQAAGPVAPQSIDAQLGHQPTARSVMQAERQAQTEFEASLARAKNFAARGDHAECMQALGVAKLMFDGG